MLEKTKGQLTEFKRRVFSVHPKHYLILFGFLFLSLALTVFAVKSKTNSYSNAEASTIYQHEIVFHFHPDLVTDMSFAKANLPKYVADMNIILAKNTNQRLIFNPDTDIVIDNILKPTGQCGMMGPATQIIAYASTSAYPANVNPYSYGGSAGCSNGNGVLNDLHWTRIYDPDALGDYNSNRDYWIQVNNMLHEMAHTYGAGLGEYYSFASMTDSTNTQPLLNISLFDPTDSFWSDKHDFFTDPLLSLDFDQSIVGNPTTRAQVLGIVKYSNLTSSIMNQNFAWNFFGGGGNPTVDLSNIRVHVVDQATGIDLPGAEVKVWLIRKAGGNYNQLLNDLSADGGGMIHFPWGTPGNPHNNYDGLRLIKVYKPGYVPAAKYVSIFDTDIAKVINGQNTYTATIVMTSDGTAPPLTPTLTPTSSPTPTPTPSPSPMPTATPKPTATPTPKPLDSTKPKVSITSPLTGALVTHGSNVTISATASDNVGVTKVNFFVGTNLKSSDTSAPYSWTWKVPATVGSTYTLKARAFDAAGNYSTVSVSVKSK